VKKDTAEELVGVFQRMNEEAGITDVEISVIPPTAVQPEWGIATKETFESGGSEEDSVFDLYEVIVTIVMDGDF
jgi:hypothetical protein